MKCKKVARWVPYLDSQWIGHYIHYKTNLEFFMLENLIHIKQDIPGFNPFFGSWLCRQPVTLLVDVGPANTGARLLNSLISMGVETLDYILLTHIHIDHGGALARILSHYPKAKVICHEKGIPHLVDPSKLYEGSVKVLGDLARTYGSPLPLQKDRIIPHTQCAVEGLRVIETPGHAPHHLCFTWQGKLYSGEAGGNYFRVGDEEYLRPATPPRFFFNVFMNSVERLMALEDQPIRYAHVEGGDSSRRLLDLFRKQLLLWDSIISKTCEEGKQKSETIEICVDLLLEQDPNLKAFNMMDSDTKKRERHFIGNAVNGFVGYLEEKAKGR